MALNGIGLSGGVIVGSPVPLDSKYGPHTNIATALTNIPSGLRHKGLTIGILDNGAIVEYWFKDGTSDNDLIQKTTGGGGASDWGDLGGTISNQTDLQQELDNKQDASVLLDGISSLSFASNGYKVVKVNDAGTDFELAVPIPRLSETDKNNINPAQDLIIYNTTSFSFEFYKNGVWKAINFPIDRIINLQSTLDGKQPLDADLTEIAALDRTESQFKVIGITDNSSAYELRLPIPTYTTANRDNLTPIEDMIIFNRTLNTLQRYSNSQWEGVAVSWSNIQNKPTEFTPSAHSHAISEVTNLQSELNSKAPTNDPTFTGTVSAEGITVSDLLFGKGSTYRSQFSLTEDLNMFTNTAFALGANILRVVDASLNSIDISVGDFSVTDDVYPINHFFVKDITNPVRIVQTGNAVLKDTEGNAGTITLELNEYAELIKISTTEYIIVRHKVSSASPNTALLDGNQTFTGANTFASIGATTLSSDSSSLGFYEGSRKLGQTITNPNNTLSEFNDGLFQKINASSNAITITLGGASANSSMPEWRFFVENLDNPVNINTGSRTLYSSDGNVYPPGTNVPLELYEIVFLKILSSSTNAFMMERNKSAAPSTTIDSSYSNLGATPSIDLTSSEGDIVFKRNLNITTTNKLAFTNGIEGYTYTLYISTPNSGFTFAGWDNTTTKFWDGVEALVPDNGNTHKYVIEKIGTDYFVTPIYNEN